MNFPWDFNHNFLIGIYIQAGAYDKAKDKIRPYAAEMAANLKYYKSLGDDVQRGYESPLPLHTEWLGRGEGAGRRRAVMLAVEMKPGHGIGDFALKVQAAIDQLRPQFPNGVEIVTVSDQPKSVAQRIDHFTLRFVEAVLLVIAVALLLMEWRAALIVAMAMVLDRHAPVHAPIPA